MSVETICFYVLFWMIANWTVAYIILKKTEGRYFTYWEKETLLEAIGIILNELLIGFLAIPLYSIWSIAIVFGKLNRKLSKSSK